MENKSKIEESLNRFNELISEGNLYGNLIDKQLLNEGGGLSFLIDDIFKKLPSDYKISSTSLKPIISTASERISKNLDSIVTTTSLKNYIDNNLSKDIKDILMEPVNGKESLTDIFLDDAGNYTKYYDEYIGVVDDLVKNIDDIKPSLSKGSVTVDSLEKSENIKKILSLLDDTDGANSFIKKYEELISPPDWTKKLPKGIKDFVDVSQKILSIGKKIALTAKETGLISDYTKWFKYYKNSKGNTIGTKGLMGVADAAVLPFRFFTKKYWKIYFSITLGKVVAQGMYCKGVSTQDITGLDDSYTNPKDIIDEDIKVYLNEGEEQGLWWLLKPVYDGIVWLLTDVYAKKWLSTWIGDPMRVLGSGWWGGDNWTCGSVVEKTFNNLMLGIGDPEFKNKIITFKDGTTMTGQEMIDDIKSQVDILIGGEWTKSKFMNKVNKYKEEVSAWKERKGL